MSHGRRPSLWRVVLRMMFLVFSWIAMELALLGIPSGFGPVTICYSDQSAEKGRSRFRWDQRKRLFWYTARARLSAERSIHCYCECVSRSYVCMRLFTGRDLVDYFSSWAIHVVGLFFHGRQELFEQSTEQHTHAIYLAAAWAIK